MVISCQYIYEMHEVNREMYNGRMAYAAHAGGRQLTSFVHIT